MNKVRMERPAASCKAVRLRGCHGKYLWAEDDFVTVSQDRDGSSDASVWTVEQVDGSSSLIRLRSCFGCYLTASEIPCLPGVTGNRVLQSRPCKLDASVDWEVVIVDEQTIKLGIHGSKFLQANSSLPPWRSSVTQDDSCEDWSRWRVEIMAVPPPKVQASSHLKPSSLYDGRIVFYLVVESEADVVDSTQWHYVFFRGRSPQKLAKKLSKEIDVVDDDIEVCIRHPSNTTKLYPVHLELPPGSAPIYLVVLKSRTA